VSSYAILRCAKLKSGGEVKASLSHAFRERETANADASLTPDNSHFGAETAEAAFEAYKALLPDKVRKNGVHCIEYLVTGSPEAVNGMDRVAQDAYFEDALEWIRERHGADKVVYAGIHRDETTPHLYAYAVPIDEKGKLNCSAFLDGRKMLSEMQTDFADRVGEKHGLERGIEGSKATHQRVKRHYGAISQEQEALQLPKREKSRMGLMVDSDETYADKVRQAVLQQAAPTLERAKVAKRETEKRKEAEATARKLMGKAKALDKFRAAYKDGLEREDQVELVRLANKLREKRALELAAKKEVERQRREASRDRDEGR